MEKKVSDNGHSTIGHSSNGNGAKLDQPQGDVAYHPRAHANRSPSVSYPTSSTSKIPASNPPTSKLPASNPPPVGSEGQLGGEKWWSKDMQLLEGEVDKIIADETSPISSENRKKKTPRGKQSPSPAGKKSPKKNSLTSATPTGSAGKGTALDQDDGLLQTSTFPSTASSILPTYSPPRRKVLSPAKRTNAVSSATSLSSETPIVQHLAMVNNHRMGHVPYSRVEKSPEKTTYPLNDNSPTRPTRQHGLTPPTRYRPYEGSEGTNSPTRSRSRSPYYSPSHLSTSQSPMLNTSINMDNSTDISRQIDDKMSDVGKAISSLQVWILFIIYHTYLLYFVVVYCRLDSTFLPIRSAYFLS